MGKKFQLKVALFSMVCCGGGKFSKIKKKIYTARRRTMLCNSTTFNFTFLSLCINLLKFTFVILPSEFYMHSFLDMYRNRNSFSRNEI